MLQKLFNSASKIEREKLATLLSINTPLAEYHHQFSSISGIDCFDAVSVKLDEGAVTNFLLCEIKVRQMYHDKYNDYVLEDDKITGLQIKEKYYQHLYKCEKSRIIYINHFNDEVYLIWNLNNIDLDQYKTMRYFNKSTVASDYKVNKLAYMLPVSLATKVDLKHYV